MNEKFKQHINSCMDKYIEPTYEELRFNIINANYLNYEMNVGDSLVLDKVFDKAQKYDEDIQRKDEYIKQLEQKNMELQIKAIKRNEWISVEDRLPESGAYILLACKIQSSRKEYEYKYVCDGFYAAPKTLICHDDELAAEYDEEKDEYFLYEGFYEKIQNWGEYSSITINDIVTHWMPLPALPSVQVEEVKK